MSEMVAYERVDPSKLVKIQCLQQAVEEARKRMKVSCKEPLIAHAA